MKANLVLQPAQGDALFTTLEDFGNAILIHFELRDQSGASAKSTLIAHSFNDVLRIASDIEGGVEKLKANRVRHGVPLEGPVNLPPAQGRQN